MGFINTLNHVTHDSIRVKIIDDHTRDSAVYSLIELWNRYDPDTLMDLVDNDPDDNDCVMSKIFARAYGRYLLNTTLILLPVRGCKFNSNDMFDYAGLMYSFKTSSPTFLNTARERR